MSIYEVIKKRNYKEKYRDLIRSGSANPWDMLIDLTDQYLRMWLYFLVVGVLLSIESLYIIRTILIK